MDIVLASMLPFLAFFVFLFFHMSRRVQCPDCGDQMPAFSNPFDKTRRMWLAGGYLCARCGCETNMSGQKVTADTPAAPFPVLPMVLLTVALTVGVGLGFRLMAVRSAKPALSAARTASAPATAVAMAPQSAPAVSPAPRR